MTRKEKIRAARKYLERIRKLDSEIRIKKETLAEVKATLGYRAKSYKERVQESISADGICDAVIELLQLEVEIGECITKYYKAKEEIVVEIFSVDDPVYLDILSYRYLKYMDFLYIAELLNYTERHIYRLHNKALIWFYDNIIALKDEKKDGE